MIIKTERKKLTEDVVKNIQCPEQGEKRIYDTESDVWVRVSANRSITYYAHVWGTQNERRQQVNRKICKVTGSTLAQARAKAEAMKKQLLETLKEGGDLKQQFELIEKKKEELLRDRSAEVLACNERAVQLCVRAVEHAKQLFAKAESKKNAAHARMSSLKQEAALCRAERTYQDTCAIADQAAAILREKEAVLALAEEERDRHVSKGKRFKDIFEEMVQFKIDRKKWCCSAHRDMLSLHKTYCKELDNKTLDEIKREDIEKIFYGMGFARRANTFLILVKSIFRYASQRDLFTGNSPASHISLNPLQARARYLKDSEFPIWKRAIEKTTHHDTLLLLLYTGARSINAVEMEWSQIDFEEQIWEIPKTKNGDSLRVMLPTQAMEILKSRREKTGDSRWVFPSSCTPGAHIVKHAVWESWNRARKGTSLETLSIHDLRRSLASILFTLGYRESIISTILGHKIRNVTGIYARVHEKLSREALQKAADTMTKLWED